MRFLSVYTKGRSPIFSSRARLWSDFILTRQGGKVSLTRGKRGHFDCAFLFILLVQPHSLGQATESILEFALHFDKPFVIVPCCVFPTLFPHRRIRAEANAVSEEAETSPVVVVKGQGGADDVATLEVSRRALELAIPSITSGYGGDRVSESASAAAAADTAAADMGVPVTSYKDLVSYLVERGGPGAHVAHLPLLGANTVVYRLEGNGCPLRGPAMP